MNTMIAEREAKVRDFLMQSATIELTDDLDLLQSGVLDSMRLMDLILELEVILETALDPSAFVADDFRTIATIRDRVLTARAA